MQKSVLQFVVLVAFYATLVLNAAVGVPLADQTSDKGAEISADFKGNGYLELNRSKIDSSQSLNSGGVAVLFSTENPNGLLFWHGQPKGETFNGTDFFSLAIINGIVELTVRLDNEQMVIKHRHYRVDNGERHVAFVKYSGNKASLELDGVTKHGVTRLTDMGEMILPGHVFLGGAPDLKNFTGERYSQGFTGCIHVLQALKGGPIYLGKNTISFQKVNSCQYDEDDY